MHGEMIVEVRDLAKQYGKVRALDGLNFEIHKGEIFGLLGPNGAGKSTFISILAAILKPSCGDVLIKGISVAGFPDKIKKSIGFVPQDVALYQTLTGLDNLNFWASIYGLKGSLKKERIREALMITGLQDRAKDKVDEYSGGMKRRLNIAVALLHHPDILIMDEPTVGVDIQSRKYILKGLKQLKSEGRTILFTSHYMEEMENLCDRIAIMDKGKIKAIGTLEELKNEYHKSSIEDIMMEIVV